jgi:hypothetical protein
MALFRRKPKFQDEGLLELAVWFMAWSQDPTPGCETLDALRLDFTVESLAAVDSYLETMRERQLKGEALGKVILRCGAYVGEVIRRNARRKAYHWLDKEEALRLDSTIADFGHTPATAFVLWDGATRFIFPLGEVMKVLESGQGKGVRSFAQAEVENFNDVA